MSVVLLSCSGNLEPEKCLNNLNTGNDTTNLLNKATLIEEVSLTDPFEIKKIKILITNHFNTYYIYKGQEFGFEFELLKQYIKYKGWKLEFELVHDSLLTKGAHLAAGSFVFPVYGDEDGLYSDYIYKTDLVLVQNKVRGIKVPSEKTPITATIVREATFITNFFRDSLEPRGIHYETLDRGTTKQELLEQVANNQIESTICTRYEADIMCAFYPNLTYNEVIVHKTPIAFLFHPKAIQLQKDFNQWLNKHRNTSDYQWIVKKYEKFPKELAKNMKYINPVVLKDKISGYDKLVQANANKIGWNWKLLSALIYQESQFNPESRGWELKV
jgi:membrane-bound lytic murein transglycosylase F